MKFKKKKKEIGRKPRSTNQTQAANELNQNYQLL